MTIDGIISLLRISLWSMSMNVTTTITKQNPASITQRSIRRSNGSHSMPIITVAHHARANRKAVALSTSR